MYDFKKLQEALWVAGISALIVALQIAFSSESVDDWQTWVIGIAGASGRAAAGAALAILTKPKS